MVRPYTVGKPFRFWCQKILPLVYDDSLSYYELLNKVVDYLNRVINNVDSIGEAFNDLGGRFESLQSSFIELSEMVDNYFDNLDVQQEINNKLDEMAQDGTLDALIQPLVDSAVSDAVSEWLDDHPEATTTVSDGSITTAKLKDANVTTEKLNDDCVTTEKLNDGCVTSGKIDSDLLATFVNPTTQSTTLTYGRKTFTFHRFGNIVVCSSGADIKTADNGYNIIGTLPEEFRPASVVVSRVSNVIDLWQFSVGADGVVRLYTTYAVTAAHNCAVNAVWVAAN